MKNKKSTPSKAAQPQKNAVNKTATGIFSKIQEKTGLSDEKLDKFQKEWLAMPANRKKYEHLTDAPFVAIEEGMAMANDILDYLQHQEGGKSLVFQKMKGEVNELVHHPVEFFKSKVEKAETLWKGFMGKAQAAKAQAEAKVAETKKKVEKKKGKK